MSKQMDLPTSRGSLAAEWAGLSPGQRQRVARVFMFIRTAWPTTKETGLGVWKVAVEWGGSGVDVPSDEQPILEESTRSGSDPEGLAFIDHMDRIAREAVVEHLLPVGSRVFGCFQTLPAVAGGAK